MSRWHRRRPDREPPSRRDRSHARKPTEPRQATTRRQSSAPPLPVGIIMTIHNRMSRTSLHQRILGDIEGRILSGALPPGARIATEQELAAAYGCARMTVSKVL